MKIPSTAFPHQYIERRTGHIVTEKIVSDRLLNLVYSSIRENATWFFNAVTSSMVTRWLGYLHFDLFYKNNMSEKSLICKARQLHIDLSECLDTSTIVSFRKLFERKIRYWEKRPMNASPDIVVSPADARMLAGSLSEHSLLFLKDKFFTFEELIGLDKQKWLQAFILGDYAVFRLTPEKYHYNHFPVSGEIVDFYEIPGRYHSCNPGAVINVVTPYSKNKRVITIINTDVENGSHIGLVAMVEIVALMIGNIRQCYSETKYENPQTLEIGMHVKKGRPKSLFKPGSSVDVLFFQKEKVIFSKDIIQNMKRSGIKSRYTEGFKTPLVETDVAVRTDIAIKKSIRGEK